MAQRQEIVLIDDVTGQDITDDGGTVRFSLDGVDYEIDLGADTAARLRSIFRPFIEAGRRVSGRRQVTPPRRCRRGPIPSNFARRGRGCAAADMRSATAAGSRPT